jgi:hypothetical protein
MYKHELFPLSDVPYIDNKPNCRSEDQPKLSPLNSTDPVVEPNKPTFAQSLNDPKSKEKIEVLLELPRPKTLIQC